MLVEDSPCDYLVLRETELKQGLVIPYRVKRYPFRAYHRDVHARKDRPALEPHGHVETLRPFVLVSQRYVIDHAHLPPTLLGQDRGHHISVTESEGSCPKREEIVLIGKAQLALRHVFEHELRRHAALPSFILEPIGSITHKPELAAEILGRPETHLDPATLHVVETVHRRIGSESHMLQIKESGRKHIAYLLGSPVERDMLNRIHHLVDSPLLFGQGVRSDRGPVILLVLTGFFVGIGAAFTNYILPEGTLLYKLFSMITNLGFLFMNNLQLWFAVAISFTLAKKEKGWAAWSRSGKRASDRWAYRSRSHSSCSQSGVPIRSQQRSRTCRHTVLLWGEMAHRSRTVSPPRRRLAAAGNCAAICPIRALHSARVTIRPVISSSPPDRRGSAPGRADGPCWVGT